MIYKYLSITSIALLFSITVNAQSTGKDHQQNTLFIKLSDNANRTAALLKKGDVSSLEQTGWFQHLSSFHIKDIRAVFQQMSHPSLANIFRFSFEEVDEDELEYLISYLNRQEDILYVEKVPLYRTLLDPDDPNINSQWHLSNIQASQAWDIHAGSGAVIAIIDDAVRITHEDLSPNLWVNPGEIPGDGLDNDNNGFIDDVHGWDLADNDNDPNPPPSASNEVFTHGTHVAGIASAASNNGIGIASIGFGAKIMSLKATSDDTEDARVIEEVFSTIQYAINNNADVINMSWGGPVFSQTFQDLIDVAHEAGIVLVAAAGNDNSDEVFYPAGYNHVISVAASKQDDGKASFSNYGETIDVTAPGLQIFSTLAGSDQSYGLLSGTSMASPLVAGLCGLAKSYVQNATPDQILSCLTSTADNIDNVNQGFEGLLGAGRINAASFLGCMNPSVPPSANFSSTSTSGCKGLSINFEDVSSGTVNNYAWQFPGGIPSTSNQENPIVVYQEAGNYPVTLMVSNEFGSDTILIENYVQIFAEGQGLPFIEDFESGSLETNDWLVDNPDDNIGWQLYEVGGTDPGNKAVGIEFFNYNNPGQRDGLQTPPLDFSGLQQVNVSFEHAYRRFNGANSDSLIILVSVDCGNTFTDRVLVAGEDGTGSFATASLSSNAFFPSTEGEWCEGDVGTNCFSVDLSDYVGNSTVVLKFEAVNQFQNNLFLDNIQITGSTETVGPQADFSADPLSECGPLVVNFENNSLRATSYEWRFPGGNPSSSNEENPNVQYNEPGFYDVFLLVTDGEGREDSIEKNAFIEVQSCEEVACDTLDNFNNGTPAVYNLNNGAGTISGHNSFADRAKADRFENLSSFSVVTGAILGFGSAIYQNEDAKVRVVVWDENNNTGLPGLELAGKDLLIQDIADDIQEGELTVITFDEQVSVNGPFYIGIELFYGLQGEITDTVTLITNVDGQTSPGTAWEQRENGAWVSYENSYGGLSVSHAIFPTVSRTSLSAVFVLEDGEVCEGDIVNVDNITENGESFTWTIQGDTSYQTSSFEPALSDLMPGAYTISLEARGACGMVNISEDTSLLIRPAASFQVQTVMDETCGKENGVVEAVAVDQQSVSFEWQTDPITQGDRLENLSFGIYEVIGTNSFGCSVVDTAIVREISGPQVEISEWKDASCGLATGNALAKVSGGFAPYNFNWNMGEVLADSFATELSAGTYSVEVTDENGCEAMASVTIAGTPSVEVGSIIKNASCQNSDGMISLSPETGIAPFSFDWDHPGIPDTSQFGGLSSGTYEIVISDANACKDTVVAVIIDEAIELPDPGLEDRIKSCGPVWISSSAENVTYQWSTGEDADSILVNSSGKYWLSFQNEEGCSRTDTIEVSISPMPNVDLGPDREACLIEVLDAGVGGMTYSWSTGEVSNLISVEKSGIYAVTAVNEDGCASSDSVAIDIKANPEASFTYELVGNQLITFNTSREAANIIWDFGDGNSSNDREPVHTYLDTGNFTITLLATNDCGSDEFEQVVVVEMDSLATSVSPDLSFEFELFPNPNNGSFFISWNSLSDREVDFTLTDFQGKTIFSQKREIKSGRWKESFFFPHLSVGVYKLNISSGGQIWSQQWLKTQ